MRTCWARSKLLLSGSKTASMVPASSAKRKFPRLGSMSFLTLPTVSSVPAAPKRADSAKPALDEPLTSSARAVRTAVFLALAAGGLGLDLATKHYIFAWRTWEQFNQTWWLL